jgi:hypothetical protein
MHAPSSILFFLDLHAFLLHTLELYGLPLPGLRIKEGLSHNFGIIINYYSQVLKPLRLSLLSNLSAPFSVTHPVEN